jgi:hypothetical protein
LYIEKFKNLAIKLWVDTREKRDKKKYRKKAIKKLKHHFCKEKKPNIFQKSIGLENEMRKKHRNKTPHYANYKGDGKTKSGLNRVNL